jgi:hypothetical protein
MDSSTRKMLCVRGFDSRLNRHGGIMRKPRMLLCGIVIFASNNVLAQPAGDPTDLRAYVTQIRLSGMSENARASVTMVAQITSGATVLTFQKDKTSGIYFPSYQSTVCSVPNADSTVLAKWKGEAQMKTDHDLQRLKPIADSDSSGFVSTQEGIEFRALVEFAIALRQISQKEGQHLDRICQGLRLTKEQLESKKTEYQLLLTRAKRLGIDNLPEMK